MQHPARHWPCALNRDYRYHRVIASRVDGHQPSSVASRSSSAQPAQLKFSNVVRYRAPGPAEILANRYSSR